MTAAGHEQMQGQYKPCMIICKADPLLFGADMLGYRGRKLSETS